MYRAELGAGPPSSLTRRVLDFFGVESVEEALHRHTGRLGGARRVDPLAAALLGEAESGDRVAREIVDAHGRALGDYALAAARLVAIDVASPFPLAMTGGVFAHAGHVLCDALVARVREDAPNVEPLRTDVRPVVGALVIAAEVAGLETAPFRDAVRASLKASPAAVAAVGGSRG